MKKDEMKSENTKDTCALAPEESLQRRDSQRTYTFASRPRILGRGAIAGLKERDGLLNSYIRDYIDDAKNGEKTFEMGEEMMLKRSVEMAMETANLSVENIDILLFGDLLNQITSSSFAALNFGSAYLGLYNACSTMAESMLVGSVLIDGGFVKTAACATASNFATAERQYRGPLELGCQRQLYAQWTVSGGACTILGKGAEGIAVTGGTVGRVIDSGITDLANMGAGMAPAAMDTLCRLFEDTKTVPKDYDFIFTGDLGKFGSDILRDLMAKKGYCLGKNYSDCGVMMYESKQKVEQGGSGCGCGAVTLNTYIADKMEAGVFNKVIFCATGALMSTLTTFQGHTMPSIAHAVVLENV